METSKTTQEIKYEALKVDKDLQLSHSKENLKEIINQSVESIGNDLKDKIAALNNNNDMSLPTYYDFVLFSHMAYKDIILSRDELYKKPLDKQIITENKLVTLEINEKGLDKWQLLASAQNTNNSNGYVGVALWNPTAQQVVIAHRGTKVSIGPLITDYLGVLGNKCVAQISSAITFTNEIVKILKEINEEKKSNIQLFFTGHSLGGWLAQITAFSAKYLVEKDGYFVHDSQSFGYHSSTLVFDSPGAREMLEKIMSKTMQRYSEDSSNLLYLCIKICLSDPNLVNSCHSHIKQAKIYSITSQKDPSLWGVSQTKRIHPLPYIAKFFDPSTGEVCNDENGNPLIKLVKDWPTSSARSIVGAVANGKELRQYLSEESDSKNTRYAVKDMSKDDLNTCSLNIFTESERDTFKQYKFLEEYKRYCSNVNFNKVFGHLDNYEGGKSLISEIMNVLSRCKLGEDNTIHSENLRKYIPFIKRVFHHLPSIGKNLKDTLDKLPAETFSQIYNSISSSYLKQIKKGFWELKQQDPQEFPCLKEFLKGGSSKVLCITSYHTTFAFAAIKLDHYLSLPFEDNKAEQYRKKHDFSSLERIFYLPSETLVNFLDKMEEQRKYLLVIECNDEQNDSTEQLFKQLSETLKKKDNVKIILLTKKDNELHKFINTTFGQQLYSDSSREGDYEVEMKFSDLTSDSQKKLLGKRVNFQGREVPLSKVINEDNENIGDLIDVETMVKLFKGEKIEIGKALPDLGETEGYYVERELVKKVKVNNSALTDKNLNDLFVISNISKGDLEKLVNEKESVRNFEEKDPDKSNPIRFITLSESAETNFENLCAEYSHHNIHWLERDNKGNLIWQKSHGNSLSGLRKYIENYESDLPEEEYSNENASIKMVNVSDVNQFNERFIVVAAEPGMGKTTALTRFGTKKANDSQWIIRINLLDYKEKLEQINFNEEDSMLAFLHGDEANTLTKKLLKSRLNQSGNIVLLLDGFDEITPEGQENVVNLLKQLQKTKVEKVLISTRLHLRNKLENSLATIAYTLKPLFSEDQKEFLKQFWRKDEALKTAIDSGSLDNYVEDHLKFLAKSIGDKERKFMGIPLQLRMVAEAFQEEAKEALISDQGLSLDNELNILELYGRFIAAKYSVYAREKMGVNVKLNEVQKNSFTQGFNKIHMRLATRVLFPEIEKSFVGAKLPSKEEEHEMNSIGIVQCINDEVIFIHRTFAEYFVAGFLYNKLKSDDEGSKKYKAIIEFLAKELFESKNEVIKTFLNYHLAKEELHTAILEGKLENIKEILSQNNTDINVTDDLGRTALHYAAQEGNEDIVKLLMEKGANVEQIDKMGRTALHYAIMYNYDYPIISLLLDNISKDSKDYINAFDNIGHTPLYYAVMARNWSTADCLVKEHGAKVDLLTSKELIFYHAGIGNLSDMQKALKKAKIGINDIRDKYNNTLLHTAAESGVLEVVKFLIDKKKADYNIANSRGERPINCALKKENAPIFYYLIKQNNDQLNYLNLEEEKSLFNLMYASVDRSTQQLIDTMKQIYKNRLSSAQDPHTKKHLIENILSIDRIFYITLDPNSTDPKVYQDILENFDLVIKIQGEMSETDTEDIVSAYRGKAYILYVTEKYKKASEVYDELYKIQKERLGDDHPDTLHTRLQKAGMLSCQEKYEEALKVYSEVFDIQKEILKERLGDDHSDTLTTRSQKAGVLACQGKYEEALKVYYELYKIQKERLGDHHSDTLTTCSQDAETPACQKKYKEALSDILQTSLRMAELKVFIFENQGEYNDAWQLCYSICEIQEETLGYGHPDTSSTRNLMKSLSDKQKRQKDNKVITSNLSGLNLVDNPNNKRARR